jgi:hypothetical protein
MFKRFLLPVILTIMSAALLAVTFLLFREKILSDSFKLVKEKSEVSVQTIIKEVLPIGEYASLSYHYTSVVKDINSKDINGWTIPFTTRKYIFTYNGTMKLGIDGTKIHIDEKAVENGQPVIVVTLPPIKILSHEIIDNSIEVFDQSQTIFNEINIQDAFKVTAERKREMETGVMGGGVVKDARTSAEQQLGFLLRSLPGIRGVYEVEFVWQDNTASGRITDF